jgi:hypothetical protein
MSVRYADIGGFDLFETAEIRVRARCKPKSDRLLDAPAAMNRRQARGQSPF